MRQGVLETETTGLEVVSGHRIIEIGAVEMVNRRLTGRTFHRYINPDRDIDDGAKEVLVAAEPGRDEREAVPLTEALLDDGQFDS